MCLAIFTSFTVVVRVFNFAWLIVTKHLDFSSLSDCKLFLINVFQLQTIIVRGLDRPLVHPLPPPPQLDFMVLF